ncbi:LD-carboxypeptidase [Clostridium sp. BJN0001]|uniref:S66 peptidase family protein n=1 Tax=Clostridium sp. BJN0001 TaxID=2930219 RepID=UPI001FD1CD11|nr:LD-carboxypeptidase [Clostridium sp. BJN0001]
MIKPNILKKGDKVGIIAPSSPVLEERIKPSIKAAEDMGLKIVLGKSVLSHRRYLAGTDEIRANDINMMFEDKSIKGIFAIRGGYGAGRILNMLKYEMIKKNPKVFVGYSDITALHIALNQKCNFITYHSPMLSSEFIKDKDDYTYDSFKNNIFNEDKKEIEIQNPDKVQLKSMNLGSAEGMLIGGNLSVITSLIGTEYEIDTKEKILFLEEVSEEPYKIDRMLNQLKLSEKLDDAKGIILGQFVNCKGKDKYSLIKTLCDYFKDLKKPVIYNLMCGHKKPTMTLKMGTVYKIYDGKLFSKI